MEAINYSVCEDCLMSIAYGGSDINNHVERELNGKQGHFFTGQPCENEDECGGDCICAGHGFSWSECELCRGGLAGTRHGATLLIKEGANEQ